MNGGPEELQMETGAENCYGDQAVLVGDCLEEGDFSQGPLTFRDTFKDVIRLYTFSLVRCSFPQSFPCNFGRLTDSQKSSYRPMGILDHTSGT